MDAYKGTEENVETLAEIPLARVESGATPKYVTDVWFRVKADGNGACRFMYSTDGKKFEPVSESFQAREGRWIGAKIGLFCSSYGTGRDRGWIDADWFRIDPD